MYIEKGNQEINFATGSTINYYEKYAILFSMLFSNIFLEHKKHRSNKDINSYLKENKVSKEEISSFEKYYNTIVQKISKEEKKIKIIQIINCLEIYYKSEYYSRKKGLYHRDRGFQEDAYRGYIRILDCLLETSGAVDFGKKLVDLLENKTKQEIQNNIKNINNENSGFLVGESGILNKDGIINIDVFNDGSDKNKITETWKDEKYETNKTIFTIGYVIYLLRNKYAHIGFPIPGKYLNFNENSYISAIIDSTMNEIDIEFMFFDYIQLYNIQNEKKILINDRLRLLAPTGTLLKKLCKEILKKSINETLNIT